MNPNEVEQEREPERSRDAEEAGIVTDPVCGMQMLRDDAEGGSAHFQDHTYYFCSDDCRQSFEDEPSRYVAPH